jgi:hypothetical protein
LIPPPSGDATTDRNEPAERPLLAHRLCAYTATRVGNVVEAEWPEFALDAEVPEWRIPRAKMKARDREHDHVVVLRWLVSPKCQASADSRSSIKSTSIRQSSSRLAFRSGAS